MEEYSPQEALNRIRDYSDDPMEFYNHLRKTFDVGIREAEALYQSDEEYTTDELQSEHRNVKQKLEDLAVRLEKEEKTPNIERFGG
ncbi:MAG: hypothetical protein ABEJ03_00560 [Candidatus Nanohaloarchaea archaeon]